MRKRGTTWRYLVVLASCGLSLCSGAGADEKDAPRPLPPEIVKAWRDAGAEAAWMTSVPPQRSAYEFWDPWREKGEAGAMPAFRFPERKAGELSKLLDPGTAFGLDFHCGFFAGVSMTELAKLKNLQVLNLGGTHLTDAALKELAGLSNLRGLYLFYTSVSDAGLKELAGMNNLQALDLVSTRVTDAGLKELAGLKILQALNLAQTAVTDAGLKELAGLKNLRWLNLRTTKVTAAGIAALQKELPTCKIISVKPDPDRTK